MPERRFQPFQILRVLARHRVEYVLIGGLAATLHGSPARTGDADICAAPEPANLDRLARALRSMAAGIRMDSEPEPLPFSCDRELLARMDVLNLRTKYGALDITQRPAGISGYAELAQHAIEMDVRGVAVKVAALEDVIRSKEAADRPKDHATLPILRALQDEIARRDEHA